MEYFTSRKLSSKVTAITDLSKVHMFLIEGNNRAAVIDTGTGFRNLNKYIETLTSLPYDVICTHGHMDHSGGSGMFDKVYLSQEDWELEKRHCTLENKIEYTRMVLGEDFNGLDDNDFAPWGTSDFLPLQDGQTFDLGGVTIEAVMVPGHTQGMTCVLFREERTMLFGDACNTAVFLFDKDASSVEGYKKSLLRLKSRENEYDKIYLSHGTIEQPKTILDDCIDVCDEIINGTDDKVNFEFMGGSYIMAKEGTSSGRVDGKLGNIIYNPNHII